MSVELPTENKDWYSLLELENYDLHAFVHHISLLDIYARGYVRPIAIIYLTRHQDKLYDQFNTILSCFENVSRLLKKGNSELFINDAKLGLKELLLVKEEGESMSPGSIDELVSDLIKKTEDITSVSISLDEVQTLLEESDNTPNMYFRNSITGPGNVYNKLLRTIEVLCPQGFEESKKELTDLLNVLHKNNIVLFFEKYHSTKDSPSCLNIGNYSVIEFSLAKPETVDIDYLRPNMVESFTSILWPEPDSFNEIRGKGLNNFKEDFHFAEHVVYSILTGRALIIQGSEVEKVMALVRTLSIFICGNKSVLEWTDTLSITLLRYHKIIGVSSDVSIPSIVANYSSLLNIDDHTLIAPRYRNGITLHQIFNHKKKWRDEKILLGYVHTVMFELAMFSTYYYHQCCLRSNPVDGDFSNLELKKNNSLDNLHSKFTIEKRRSDTSPNLTVIPDETKDFFDTHKITGEDREIVKYFAETIKEQQALSLYSTQRTSPVLHLDHRQLFFWSSPTAKPELYVRPRN
eukprot:TRINITY_DN5195_c0_g1_i2.p1 TRINITY_DN5195_c0_g1~~TRINITY_DN5195_c0_g1_i2.p1  ORF type:complete len:519 (+),score=85.53 TRINITY_DN5195_c0_g1_i2:178-1734(+)